MEDFNWGAFLGITLGIICGLTGFWWGRRAAAKQRGLDERFDLIRLEHGHPVGFPHLLGRAFFLLLLFGVKLSAAAVLGILLFIHLGSWAIFVLYYQAKL